MAEKNSPHSGDNCPVETADRDSLESTSATRSRLAVALGLGLLLVGGCATEPSLKDSLLKDFSARLDARLSAPPSALDKDICEFYALPKDRVFCDSKAQDATPEMRRLSENLTGLADKLRKDLEKTRKAAAKPSAPPTLPKPGEDPITALGRIFIMDPKVIMAIATDSQEPGERVNAIYALYRLHVHFKGDYAGFLAERAKKDPDSWARKTIRAYAQDLQALPK